MVVKGTPVKRETPCVLCHGTGWMKKPTTAQRGVECVCPKGCALAEATRSEEAAEQADGSSEPVGKARP